MSNTANLAQKHIKVSQKRISCDGGGGALGHPKVWLDMGMDTQVVCKYCDRVFVLDTEATTAS